MVECNQSLCQVFMGKLRSFSRVLGPRGLNAEPKLVTVTMDVAKAGFRVKAGKIVLKLIKRELCMLQ